MKNLEHLPPHELRSHWLTAITSSFNLIIIWRAARDRQYIVREQLELLHLELPKLLRLATTNDLWTYSKLADWLQKYTAMYIFVIEQYQRIMDQITRCPLPWPLCPKIFRESLVKRSTVLHAYFRLVSTCFVNVFLVLDENGGAIRQRLVRCEPLRVRPVWRLTRRWSASDVDTLSDKKKQYAFKAVKVAKVLEKHAGDIEMKAQLHAFHNATTVRNRWALEHNVIAYLRQLDRAMVEGLLDIRARYNSGELFRTYWEWVVWSNETRREQDRSAGRRYRYPRWMWQMKDFKSEEEEKWWRPEKEVPRYEEDEELMRVFH